MVSSDASHPVDVFIIFTCVQSLTVQVYLQLHALKCVLRPWGVLLHVWGKKTTRIKAFVAPEEAACNLIASSDVQWPSGIVGNVGTGL